MHSYLRSVGFGHISSRYELDQILGAIMDSPTEKHTLFLTEKRKFVQYNKDFGDNIGISIIGEYDEKGFFHIDHYYPYGTYHYFTAKESVVFNKRIDTDTYTGMCDDMRLGVSLIFYLLNINEYKKRKLKDNSGCIVNISLSALCLNGKILLGTASEQFVSDKKISELKRSQLISDARNGDQDAIDRLTIDEIDLYAMISRRSKYEDVYSIVENSFIPYGSESDNYSIVGTIINWNLINNILSKEQIYQLHINCNGLIFSVYINQTDLLGEPMIGRRFKGNVWMQGVVDFADI